MTVNLSHSLKYFKYLYRFTTYEANKRGLKIIGVTLETMHSYIGGIVNLNRIYSK